jgi:hypothetical protein
MRAICRRYGVVPSSLVLVLITTFVTLLPGSAGAATFDPAALVASDEVAAAAAGDPYADPARWLCRGDADDACDHNLDATVVRADGSLSVERWTPAANAPVDCFYVYPTVSLDLALNSDATPDAYQEIAAVRLQAARLGSRCRVFAPVYRQGTLLAGLVQYLQTPHAPYPFAPDVTAMAYADVVAAFRHYLAADNGGRGFVLIGHSQGAGLLAWLLQNEIQPDPALRSRFVSAYLLGLPATTPPHLTGAPPCTAPTQTGCVIAFSSFRAAGVPPWPGSIFAQPGPGACTNPAALGGGRATLRPYFYTYGRVWTLPAGRIRTPFVTLPNFVQGECVTTRQGLSYLAITVNGNIYDPRTDNIPGDVDFEWGLHLDDAQLVMGDLVDLLGRQSRAYAAARR